MARTVKVGLDVDEQPFTRGVERATKATEKLEDALDDVTGSAAETTAATERASDSVDDLGDSAKDAGRDLSRLRADAERLDRQIDETTASVRELARAIAATSDEAERADLSKKLTVEQGKLRERVTLRKLIDVESASDMGAELAQQVSLSFGARLGPLLARAPLNLGAGGGAAAAIAAPLVAGLTTVVGAAVGAAIVGGVGAGGVLGGVALAGRDPRVQAQAKALGEDLGKMLGRASSAFVPETMGALDTIRDRVRGMEGDFERGFSSAARFVDPLVDGLLDAAENAMPGLLDAIDAAGPVIDVVADAARGLGDALGDGLSGLAPYADEGARALQILFMTMEGGVRIVFGLIEGLSWLYQQGELFGAVLTGNIPRVFELAAANQTAATSAEALAGKSRVAADGILGTGSAAAEATPKVQTWAEFLNESLGRAFEGEEANIRLEEAIDRVGEAAKRGAEDGIDPATKAGRENRKALLEVAAAANASHDAILESTGSQELATEAKEKGRTAFLKAAEAMGVEAGQAKNLADKLFGIPKERKSEVKADTAPARTQVTAYLAWLNRQDFDRNGTVTITERYIAEQRTARGGPREFNRWGGVYEHAAEGVLREAQIASPMGPARYAWAEPATGGEAFIPRFGNRERSLDILSHAARWYGQQVVPAHAVAPSGAGGAADPARHIAAAVRSALTGMAVYMDGRVVGHVQGRQADIYART